MDSTDCTEIVLALLRCVDKLRVTRNTGDYMLQKTDYVPCCSPFTLLKHAVGSVTSPWRLIRFGINAHQATIFNAWSMGLRLLLRRRDRKQESYWHKNSSQVSLPRPLARMWNGYLYQGRVEMGILARTILGQQIPKDWSWNKCLTFGLLLAPFLIRVINLPWIEVTLNTSMHKVSQAH